MNRSLLVEAFDCPYNGGSAAGAALESRGGKRIMADQPPTLSPEPGRSPGGSPRGLLTEIFIGPHGPRAGWRLLVFAAIFILVQFILLEMLIHSPYGLRLIRMRRAGSLDPLVALVSEIMLVIALLVAVAVMVRFEKRNFRDYGLARRPGSGRRFALGLLWGWAAVTVMLLIIRAAHGFSFGSLAEGGVRLAGYGLLWTIFVLLVGFFEEFSFRGYAQFTLATGMGFWPAAVLLSACFGAAHLINPGETWAGAVSAGLIGLFFCLTLRRTGNLWFAIGMHASFDFSEVFLYSVPVSGLPPVGHLLNSSYTGPNWLTGGTVGPEASVAGFAVIALLFLLFDRLYRPAP
jgi:CAAX protease family protein